MKTRTFSYLGFTIEMYKFGNKSFIYPQFNGNAEFEVTKKGFKKLHTYLKNMIWIQNRMKSFNPYS